MNNDAMVVIGLLAIVLFFVGVGISCIQTWITTSKVEILENNLFNLEEKLDDLKASKEA